MITITDAAAEQVRKAAEQAGTPGASLRIAARPMPDGGIDHTMGFDEPKDEDMILTVNDVQVLISPGSKLYLQGLTLDWVEYQPGEHRFIFVNPNDQQKETDEDRR
jgi:iron-sulfur cluster assembly protein